MKQSEALNKLLFTRDNIFLTGDAGSGKTYLIRKYISESTTPIGVTASTGVAATLLGGTTVHSFFGIGKGGVKAYDEALKNRRAKLRIRSCNTLVIDEISMLGKSILELIDRVARTVRENPDSPFGGIRVIAVGDFNQLCPVDDDWAFNSKLWESFFPVYLTDQYRSSDTELIECLKDIREGKIYSETKTFLDKCKENNPKGTVKLLSRNISVEEFNVAKLDKLKSKLFSFQTKYKWANKNKKGNYYEHQRNFPIGPELRLKIGAQVMIRRNAYDREGRVNYVNGDLGKVEDIDNEVIYVKRYNDNAVIPLGITEFTIDDPLDGEPIISAFNFPLMLSWATSIHKSQGQTLQRVSMDLSKCFAPGQFYVALSRAADSKNLHIEDWRSRSILVDKQVLEFYNGLQP